MKKLLILTAALLLTSSTVGCRWCENWWRGSSAPPVYSAPVADPCNPCAPPCAAPCVAPCGPVACGPIQ